jgi:DNA-binding CsgD family transcriptional regulator
MALKMTTAPRGRYPNNLGFGNSAAGLRLVAMASERARRRCREQVVELVQRPADPFILRFRIVELLRPVVGFDRWCWPVCDPGSGLGTTAVGDHDYWPALPRLLLLDQRLDAPDTLAMLVGASARDGQDVGLRFLDVLGPTGIGDELRVPLRDKHGLWGCLDLMRSSDDQPFTDEDRDLLDALVPALAAVTRRSTAVSASGGGAPPPPAGVLVLDADLDVRASTAGARAWLGQLVPPNLPFAELAAFGVVFNVASRVLARPTAAGLGGHPTRLPARARVRSMTGAWAVVEADALDPLERTVAVTIRPAAATEILDLRFHAYDLTVRERELVSLLLDGSDTRTVSERLFLSPHTVQDHLKSIFEKTGVRTRKELVAALANTDAPTRPSTAEHQPPLPSVTPSAPAESRTGDSAAA